MSNKLLNVYFYALYDAHDQEAHSGLTANICAEAVRDDVRGNYVEPRYITIHRVPDLVGVVNSDCTVSIVPRQSLNRSEVAR